MEPAHDDEPSGFQLPVSKDVALLGLLALAVVVAAGFAAENDRLRKVLNGPAMGKARPCDCDADETVHPSVFIPDPIVNDYNAFYKGAPSNGNTGLRTDATADSGADASGGDNPGQ